jgi:hypothetical protein
MFLPIHLPAIPIQAPASARAANDERFANP